MPYSVSQILIVLVSFVVLTVEEILAIELEQSEKDGKYEVNHSCQSFKKEYKRLCVVGIICSLPHCIWYLPSALSPTRHPLSLLGTT